jgi:acyl carrier protein
MTISSRTPEGIPHRCSVCGNISSVEPSYPNGDSCCPRCGQLLLWFRDRLSQRWDLPIERISLSSSFAELGADSLEVVELVMEIEEEFKITIPKDDAEQIKTIADLILYLGNKRQI